MSLALAPLLPNVLTAVAVPLLAGNLDFRPMFDVVYACAAALFAVTTTFGAVLGVWFGRRHLSGIRRWLVFLTVTASAATAIAAAIWRGLVGALPFPLGVTRGIAATLVEIAVGIAVIHLASPGPRRSPGYAAVGFGGMTVLLTLGEMAGISPPLGTVANVADVVGGVGAWASAVVGLLLVAREGQHPRSLIAA